MYRPWWFPEYSINQQIVFEQLKNIIENNNSKFWYYKIDTPVVESNNVLLAKSWQDASKQIFWLYWLAQWSSDLKPYSLRFDLTIPLARYVLDRQNELVFPFKRQHTAPVRRWERQKRWRYRQFYQSDIDIVFQCDQGEKYLYYDAEVVFVLFKSISEIVSKLWLNYLPVVKINNRKIIAWLLEHFFWVNDSFKYEYINLIDWYYKLWKELFIEKSISMWVSEKDTKKIFEFLSSKVDLSNIKDFYNKFDNDLYNIWIEELYQTITNLNNLAKWFNISVNYEVDFFIVRWLDYYTGMVFETYFENDMWLWSICSWWRYENLTTYINPKLNFWWVWWSIWIDRLVLLYFENESKTLDTSLTDYLFINFWWESEWLFKLANKFLSEWKKIEIYPKYDKLKKQISYADKKNIRYIVIMWESEIENNVYKIKDLSNWKEESYKLEFY